jgi:alkanesulfonate monooxygenase SsuD/methylene tetrahydromethanopterin reductase-like flavin-dependent oxidoreductase (luciferase family)/predicted kinase
MSTVNLPDPAIVVLIGPAGSGKSTWAAARYAAGEIVSSDALRAVVGTGPHDLEASIAAFDILDAVLAARAVRGLTSVIDTLGLDQVRRRGYLAAAHTAGLPAVAVLMATSAAECRRRNASRDVPVPATALDQQLRAMRAVRSVVGEEGWDLVLTETAAGTPEPAHLVGPVNSQARPAASNALEFVLQISRFPWGDDPLGWLTEVAGAADAAGFAGVALMDHLIQIPQVGRAWEPIPDPWTTLAVLGTRFPGLRVGTLVSPVTFRRAGVLAKTVATVDALTGGGRVFCGLGAGWWDREHAGFGVPFPSPDQRLTLLEDAITTLRALWAPGTKALAGPRVSLPETTCYPRPSTAIPLIVGGSGPRTLRIAARLGDGCNMRTADLERALPVLHAELDRIGRPRDELELSVLDVPVIGTDRTEVGEIVERLRGRTSAATFAARHRAGTVDQQIVRYRGLADTGVRTVFLALPDLAGPDEVLRCAPVAHAFAAPAS